MPKKINVKGLIIPNDYKWFFELFEIECTCPKDVEGALEEAENNEDVEVYINSPGGVVDAGSEIYTMLRAYQGELKIFIVGEACSAASVLAMARYCEMSPTALMMLHCASTRAAGNHNDFEHVAGVLRTVDDAIAGAYAEKSGMSKEGVLLLMEQETWLTAEKAKEKGLIDAIMFEDEKGSLQVAASTLALPNFEKLDQFKELLTKQQNGSNGNQQDVSQGDEDPAFLVRRKKLSISMNLLKLERMVVEDDQARISC